MTVLVLGATGRLGSIVCARRPEFVTAPHQDFDITKENDVIALFSRVRPRIVLNFAAITDMALCQTNPELCNAVNAEAVKTIAHACMEQNIYLVHISSDAAIDPVNAYAKAKAKSEVYAIKAGVAIRVNFYNKDSFIPKNLLEKKNVTAYTDVFFNPISMPSFVDFLLELTDNFLNTKKHPYEGVISVGVQERLSSYQFATLFCEEFSLPQSLVTSSTQPPKQDVPRSQDTYIAPINSLSAREDLKRFKQEISST